MIQLSAADVAEQSLDLIEGSIVVFYGEADSTAIQKYDEAVQTEDTQFQKWMGAELEATLESSEESESVSASAELTYYGRTIVDDLTLAEDESFGVELVEYNGGDLDEDGFKVDEAGESSVEYRIIAVPPALDEAEEDAMETIPADTDGSVRASQGSDLCGTLTFGFAVGAALAAGSSQLALDTEELTTGPDGMSSDMEADASVDDLIEAQI